MPKRYILIIALLITFGHDSMAQLTVDSRMTVRDSLTNTYLCTVPEECFKMPLTVNSVTLNDSPNVLINGTDASHGYTFDNISANSTWTVSNESGTIAMLQFTFLPIVSIEGTVSNDYSTGNVTVITPSNNIASPCKIKNKGGSSNLSYIQKRNYHLKFVDDNNQKTDYKFFDDMRSDNNWILDAGTLDRIRVRNRVFSDLWNDIATPPYYATEQPKALTGTRGKMVEVFKNGEYQGVYVLSEAIDRKQLKLKKYDEQQQVINGQLWKVSDRTSTTQMQTSPRFNNASPTWSGFEVEYPDFDDISPTEYSTLYNAINFVAHSNDEDFAQHVHEYLDIPVLRDLYIFLQLTLGFDNLGKNIYWACYDRNTSNIITPIPYDFDATAGQSWKRKEYHPGYLSPDVDLYTSRWDADVDQFLYRNIKWNVNNFNGLATQRYNNLRTGPLHTDSIMARFMNYIVPLQLSGALQREEARWKDGTDNGNYPVNFMGEYYYIRWWFYARMPWLDSYFAQRITGDTNEDNQTDITDIGNVINHLLGNSSVPDIYSYKLDVNNNHSIDISDVNALVDIILHQ